MYMVSHSLLRCCRAKTGLISPGKVCLVCSLVPLLCRGCGSFLLGWLAAQGVPS